VPNIEKRISTSPGIHPTYTCRSGFRAGGPLPGGGASAHSVSRCSDMSTLFPEKHLRSLLHCNMQGAICRAVDTGGPASRIATNCCKSL
jgi:hypothetical protein